MSLPIDLISQFVKVTNDDTKTTEETTVYGTTVEYGGRIYVRLDGSELLTPVTTTAVVKNNERVTVRIKNHTATITGNVTSPAAQAKDVEKALNAADKISEFEIAIAYRVSTEELEAINAVIDSLKAKVAKFGDVDIVNADIETLRAKYASLEYVYANDMEVINANIEKIQAQFGDFADISAEELEALNAEISNLQAYNAEFTYVSADVLKAFKATIDKLDVNSLTAKYANIDFSNIGEAAIERFFSKSGLIEDVAIGDGTITGTLVGVTIKGDLIEGNTVVADKLVIKGKDGLYYKLNTDGVKTEAEQTDYNSLNGSVITAKSITASKITVDDLVAFGATIGGFHITNNSLYSGVKSTVDNTTRGSYLDKDGQVSFGDANNFIKYYRDADGNYKLAISASSMVFATSNKSVEAAINDAVETMSISGRNLIVRKGERIDTYVVASGEVTEAAANYKSATILDPIRIEAGQTYTFSKDESASKYFFRWAWYDSNMNVLGRSVGDAASFQWTAPEDAYYAIISYPYVEGANPKLEKGTAATAYTPAIEDLADTIDNAVLNSEETLRGEIDDLSIGGRNLIKNSDFRNGTDKWVSNGVSISVESDETFDSFVKMVSTEVGSSTQRLYPSTTENFVHDPNTYALSFYAKADAPTTMQTNIAGGDAGAKDYSLTTEWQRFTHVYEASAGSLTFWPNEANTTIYLTKIKLEIGDKATDWTPAVEDMAMSDDVDKAQELAEKAAEDAELAKALFAQLSEAIAMLVTDGNGTSLMTQTPDGWTFSTADLQNTISAAVESLDTLANDLGDATNTVEVLKQAVADLGSIAEYVKIRVYEDEPCIELGEADSDFKLLITNTRIMFMEGSGVPAYISNQSLFIKKAVIEEELQQGEFVWKARSNGNLGLIWKGVNS